MELEYAFLADSAQVQGGKTYVLGGGIAVLWRQSFPAPLGCALVTQFSFHRTELGKTHDVSVQVMDADGNPVLPEIKGQMRVGQVRQNVPNVPLVVPLVLNFPPLPVLQRPGSYSIELLVDGRHLKSVPFQVAHPPTQPALRRPRNDVASREPPFEHLRVDRRCADHIWDKHQVTPEEARQAFEGMRLRRGLVAAREAGPTGGRVKPTGGDESG